VFGCWARRVIIGERAAEEIKAEHELMGLA
jgi:hypothetical protein